MMRFFQLLSLSCLIGLANLSQFSSTAIAEQSPEPKLDLLRDGTIKGCKGQLIDLNMPQLTHTELSSLASCSSVVIPQLHAALESSAWQVRAVAAFALGLMGIRAQSAIPALSNLMEDENADVRLAATQALGKIGTTAVVPALSKALQDNDENVQVSAAFAFKRIGGAAQPAKPILINALWDGNWFVRRRAAETISRLGIDVEDIPALVKPLRDPTYLGGDYDGAITSVMLSIYPPIFNKLEDLPIFFIQGLKSKNPKVRESSAVALGQISSTRPGCVRLSESMYALKNTLEDQDLEVRIRALEVLGRFSDWFPYYSSCQLEKQDIENIQSLLIQNLQDTEARIRQISMEALIGITLSSSNLSKGILAALEAIDDEDPLVRQYAYNFLSGSRSHIDIFPKPLKSQLLKKVDMSLKGALYDRDSSVRQGNYIPTIKLMPTLLEIFQQKKVIDSEIRYDALAKIIELLRDRQFYLREASNYEEFMARYQQFKTMSKLVEEALEDPDLQIRLRATSYLEEVGNISSKEAVSIFIEGLNSDIPLARIDAVSALSNLCLGENHEVTCNDAKVALPFLTSMLREDIQILKYAAAIALGSIQHREQNKNS